LPARPALIDRTYESPVYGLLRRAPLQGVSSSPTKVSQSTTIVAFPSHNVTNL